MSEELRRLFLTDQGLPVPDAPMDWRPVVGILLGVARASRATGATTEETAMLLSGVFQAMLADARARNEDQP